MHYVIHKFLKDCFKNTHKRKVLHLRLHNIFNRDVLEGKLDIQVQQFGRNFRREAN